MPESRLKKLPRLLGALLLATLTSMACAPRQAAAQSSFAEVVASTQPRLVKIYGAGGLRGLEAYQSGMLISDDGYILTVWSYVLTPSNTSVVLDDGREFHARIVGADPRLDIALLKIEAEDLLYFDLNEASGAEAGDRVLAFSNLFGVATGDEPASVLHGSISVVTSLAARRGGYSLRYTGPVYVLDAMTNNPGAAGGALTDRQGRLIGLLGKEVRNEDSGAWLNYAMPIEELRSSIEEICSLPEGQTLLRSEDESARLPDFSLHVEDLGLVLVPEVLDNTPPFVDAVRSESSAASEGVESDDLILFVDGRMVQSVKEVVDELAYIHRDDSVSITVLRGEELLEFTLEAPQQ